jgi:hypothetical protein
MSHFSEVRLQFRNAETIVEALKAFGFEVNRHEKPQLLRDYMNSTSQYRKAEIIVPKESIGRDANDMGFIWNGDDNAYMLYISEYDLRTGSCKAGYGLGSSFVQQVSQKYLEIEIPKNNGLEITSSEPGRIVLRQKKAQLQQISLGGQGVSEQSSSKSFGF